MNLRKATINDADILLEWRNDQATRINSKSSDRIDRETHMAWLEQTLANKDKILLIAEIDGTAIGTVRIDTFNGSAELNWTIAPASRGRGYGTTMLREAVKIVSVDTLWAIIKMENQPSRRIAEKAGFIFYKMSDDFGVWKMDKRRGDSAPAID